MTSTEATTGVPFTLNGEEQPRRFVDKYEFIDDSCLSQTTKRYVETLGAV